jgi:membrane protein implicated in regulation of membrane protease activity
MTRKVRGINIQFKSTMLGIAGIVTFLDVMLWAGFIVSVTTVDTENLPLPGNAPWSVELILLLMFTVLSVLCWMLYQSLKTPVNGNG